MTILIQLEDGISTNEHLLSAEVTGYIATGESVIEHHSYGTVGKRYNPATQDFEEVPRATKDMIDILSQSELIYIDKLKVIDPIRYKILASMLVESELSEDSVRQSFSFMIDEQVLPSARLLEILMESSYYHMEEELSQDVRRREEEALEVTVGEGIDVNP